LLLELELGAKFAHLSPSYTYQAAGHTGMLDISMVTKAMDDVFLVSSGGLHPVVVCQQKQGFGW
jgi:hypothetical protein